MSSPAVTRNSASKSSASKKKAEPSFTLLDIQKLMSASEEKIISHVNNKIDELSTKIGALESAVTQIKAVQVQQESDLNVIKDIIVGQQYQIEACEERERECNLMISNIPETDVSVNGETLTDDESKVLHLMNHILPSENEMSAEDICKTVRLGSGGRNPRMMKLVLPSVEYKIKILRSCKNLNSSTVRSSYGRVFVNKDMSVLRRREEKRLRMQARDLRSRYPEADVRVRGGKLYVGPVIRDSINYRNLLF